MVSVVLQMNGLDRTYPKENNMYQLMVMNQILLVFYMVYPKVSCLVHFSFLIYISDLNQAITQLACNILGIFAECSCCNVRDIQGTYREHFKGKDFF